VTDSSHGGTSLHSGELELMVHRRLLFDADQKGVMEPLNETEGGCSPYNTNVNDWASECADLPPCTRYGEGIIVSGITRLVLESPGSSAAVWRPLASAVLAKPVIGFLPGGARTTGRGIDPRVVGVPPSVDLITRQWTDSPLCNLAIGGCILLRLAHIYAAWEDPVLSQIVNVSLASLLPPAVRVTQLLETSLTANQMLSDLQKKRVRWNSTAPSFPAPALGIFQWESLDYLIEMGPMIIRTFIVQTSVPSN